MIRVTSQLEPKSKINKLHFGKRAFIPKNLPNNLGDKIYIKNKPVSNDAGLSLVSDEFKKGILRTNLGILNIKLKPDNTVKTRFSALGKSLNSFVQTFPDFVEIFKHKKNDRDGLDIHTLKTFKKVLQDKEYQNLPKKEQNILELASLFHDLGKIDVVGVEHPKFSKIRTQKLLKDTKMPDEDKQKVIKLVRHHYWNSIVSKNPEKTNAYAQIFSMSDLKLLKILTKADINARKNKTKQELLKTLSLNFQKQSEVILGRQAHLSAVAKDNKYRADLAKSLNVDSAKLKSVVGINEFKFLLKNKFKQENFSTGVNDENIKSGIFQANFHIHTVNSDGELTAQKLVDEIKNYTDKTQKPFYFATTDHNDVNANRQVLEILADNPEKFQNLRFIPGIEIRNNHKNADGSKVFFETLVYGLDPYKKGYKEFLPHMKHSIDLKDVAEFFEDQDVFLSLAHPHRTTTDNLKNFVGEVFAPNNGQGLESYYAYSQLKSETWIKDRNFKPDDVASAEAKAIAEEFGLLSTGGRDNHGDNFFYRR